MAERICVLQDIAPDFDFSEITKTAFNVITAEEAVINAESRAKENGAGNGTPQLISIYAGKKTAKCRGCFGCWLKTPGECIIRDGREHLGSAMMSCDKVYIFSRSCYGGFSVEIKRLLDRCIPGVLPFFRYIERKIHHVPRFKSKPEYIIAFYDMADCTKDEKETAVKAAKAMSVNFNAKSCKVALFDDEITEKEAADL